MLLLDEYLLPPACCFICRAAKRTPDEAIFDVSRDADLLDGGMERVCICGTCAGEMATMLGWAKTETVQANIKIAAAARAQVDQLQAEIDDLNGAIAALRRAGYESVAPSEPDLTTEARVAARKGANTK